MREGVHWASVASWDGLGVEIASGDGEVTDAVVARAWRCSCGWRGAVRPVDDRFYRPPGDVGGRLRAARVRRSDRKSHAAWAHHRLEAADDDAPPGAAAPAADVEVEVEVDPVVGGSTARGDEEPGAADRRAAPSDPRTPELRAPARGSGDPDDHAPVVSARAERARRRHLASSAPATRTASPRALPDQTAVPGVDPSTAAAGTAGPAGTSAATEIARGAARVDRARRELSAADASLRDAVLRARADGLSWRAIAVAAGVDHRVARDTWTSDAASDTAF